MNPRDEKRFKIFLATCVVFILTLTAVVLLVRPWGMLALPVGVVSGWLLGRYGFDYVHHYGRFES